LALPREALERATLLPNSTLPVLTAMRICLFTSNWFYLLPFRDMDIETSMSPVPIGTC